MDSREHSEPGNVTSVDRSSEQLAVSRGGVVASASASGLQRQWTVVAQSPLNHFH